MPAAAHARTTRQRSRNSRAASEPAVERFSFPLPGETGSSREPLPSAGLLATRCCTHRPTVHQQDKAATQADSLRPTVTPQSMKARDNVAVDAIENLLKRRRIVWENADGPNRQEYCSPPHQRNST